MSELHEALKLLSPLAWDDVPQQDDLPKFLQDSFVAGELICNTVPPPPEGTPFASSKPHFDKPNAAKSHKEMHPSDARPQPPPEEHAALQKTWGKPVKVNKKDNPLDVCIYKTAGNDRHGAWFARRSVHEGLGFDKFRRAMLREFVETMAVTGGPGAGAVRGIAADRQLEYNEVKEGSVAVYDLSAQFPGPTTPRQFVTLLMCSDDALTAKSTAESQTGEEHVPRHFMVISRPVTHADAPEHSGLVRGQYESVELIREIPIKKAPNSKSTPNLPSNNSQSKEEAKDRKRAHSEDAKGDKSNDKDDEEKGDHPLDDEAELNPVEWIMISRSDPGGGIPRFLVDRGTPEAMLSDLHKFLTWACSQDYIPLPDEAPPEKRTNNEKSHAAKDPDSTLPKRASILPADAKSYAGGLISNITGALEAGIDSYAPATVSNLMHKHLLNDDISDESDTSSDSFLSAEDLNRVTTAPENHPTSADDPSQSLSNLSKQSSASIEAAFKQQHKKNLSSHEKEILKIAQKRDKLNHDLERKRHSEEDKLRQSQEKDESDATKHREKIEKELQKAEEKHRKQLEKLQQKREKEVQKAEARRRKKDDQNKLSLVTRERDEFRSQADLWKREVEALRRQVAELQERNESLEGEARIAKEATLTPVATPATTTPLAGSSAASLAAEEKSLSGLRSQISLGSTLERIEK